MKEISQAVDKNRELILEAERYIWKHPETGYKEFETNAYMTQKFKQLGYDVVPADNITGFYAILDTGRKGPEVMILAELDSIICPAHKDANPITGAVHSCGHNAQCATLLGIAAALKEPGILDKFSGRIRLVAVPAEELLEIEYRSKLKSEGKIKYYGGKSEFLYRGYFDGVDIAFMVHTSNSYSARLGSIGCIAKTVTYKGVASHAGGSPSRGINALYAATCGINAVNAIRETFVDSEHIRVHPIITHGGEMVNAIPDRVTLESYVRGTTLEAISKANKKVNRALIGAALSLGANIDITDTPGYSPLLNDKNMLEVVKDAMALALPDEEFNYSEIMGTGSTDMGDLSCVMPVVHPYAKGACGRSHGDDYKICDPESACVKNAKWQLAMLLILLQNNAERAYRIIEEFKPIFKTKEEFFEYQDSLNISGERIVYNDDSTAQINLK